MKKLLGLIVIIFVALLSLTLVSCNKSTSSGGGEQIDEDKILSAVEVYEKVNPSVACVFSLDIDGNYSSGSGFFIDNNGTLVTNYHVIKDAIAIVISMYDNEKDSSGNYYKATSVLDMSKDLDIAILQTNKSNSVPVKLDTSDVAVGEKVYAIGYPESFTLGWEESTFSQGMITKKSMEIDGQSYIQSDVNITHGNSGGVLINEKGKVIGITSAGIRFNGIDYMNLSIPVEKMNIFTKSLYLPIEEIPFYYLPYVYSYYVDGELFKNDFYGYWNQERVPSQPTKTGYSFAGWKERDSQQQWSFIHKVTRSKQFDAIFKAREYEITLDVNEGDQLSNNKVSVEYNSKKYLPVPSRRYYDFTGWYLSTPDGLVQYTASDGFLLRKWDIANNQTLIAVWTKTQYRIICTKNNNDAGTIEYPAKAEYGDNVTITATTNYGYTWVGWYENNKLFHNSKSFSISMPAQNIAYEARWCKVNLVKNDSAAGTVTSLTNTYLSGQHVTIKAVTNDGYTWLGWYKNDVLVSTDLEYDLKMPTIDETYEARWTYYTLSTTRNDSQAGSVTYYSNKKVTAGEEITIKAINYDGYTFIGWYNNGVFVTDLANYSFEMPRENVIYEARWTYYTLQITKNNSNAGTTTSNKNYKVTAGTSVTIGSTTNEGYTWLGWYKNDSLVNSSPNYTFTMPSNNETYEARWNTNTYTITINNHAEGVTISGAGNYEYGSEVTLIATNVPNTKYISWKNNNQLINVGDIYSFTMGLDFVIDAYLTDLYTRDSSTLYFGSYPQTEVTDTSLKSTLNSLNSYSWTSYEYYIDGSVQSYMWYQDITYGGEKYRGVYFNNYRPYNTTNSSSTSKSFQDDNGYNASTVYWFKWEPIKWDVLKEESGKALLIADLLLDSQDYYWSNGTSSHSHNGGTGYSNNYELSHIRKWLNDTFYNTAFNDVEKAIIETTTVDNSVASTGYSSNSYACNNTSDKVFLLSYQEATTYYGSNDARKAQGTDYAKCQGLYVNSNFGYWLLRSSTNDYTSTARVVCSDGSISNYSVSGTICGVRPALWINL